MLMIPKTHSLQPSHEGPAVLARDPVQASLAPRCTTLKMLDQGELAYPSIGLA